MRERMGSKKATGTIKKKKEKKDKSKWKNKNQENL